MSSLWTKPMSKMTNLPIKWCRMTILWTNQQNEAKNPIASLLVGQILGELVVCNTRDNQEATQLSYCAVRYMNSYSNQIRTATTARHLRGKDGTSELWKQHLQALTSWHKDLHWLEVRATPLDYERQFLITFYWCLIIIMRMYLLNMLCRVSIRLRYA